LREVTSGQAIAVLEDMLCYLNYNNARFSITVIRMIMVYYMSFFKYTHRLNDRLIQNEIL